MRSDKVFQRTVLASLLAGVAFCAVADERGLNVLPPEVVQYIEKTAGANADLRYVLTESANNIVQIVENKDNPPIADALWIEQGRLFDCAYVLMGESKGPKAMQELEYKLINTTQKTKDYAAAMAHVTDRDVEITLEPRRCELLGPAQPRVPGDAAASRRPPR